MSFLRTSSITGVSIGIKMLTLLLINKVIAVYIGPSGYVIVGQFQNIMQIFTTISGGFMANGVVKYTAQYHQSYKNRDVIWKTTLNFSIILSIGLGILFTISAVTAPKLLIGSDSFKKELFFAGLFLPFFVLNSILISIINGLKCIKEYAIVTIFGSLSLLFITSILTIRMGVSGTLQALIFSQIIIFAITIKMLSNTIEIKSLLGKIDYVTLKQMLVFSSMAIVSNIFGPLTHIAIRNLLIEQFGNDVTGEWEALNRLSNVYLTFLTLSVSYYFIPRISELFDKKQIALEMYIVFRWILPTAAVTLVCIFMFRYGLIALLFSNEFQLIGQIMSYQLIGDFFKISSLLFGLILISKAMILPFVLLEITFSVTLYVITLVISKNMGVGGITIAYAINYLIYLICASMTVYFKFFKKGDH